MKLDFHDDGTATGRLLHSKRGAGPLVGSWTGHPQAAVAIRLVQTEGRRPLVFEGTLRADQVTGHVSDLGRHVGAWSAQLR